MEKLHYTCAAMQRRWIPVVFWILFLSVLGLSTRFPRLNTIWPVMLLLAVGGLAINYLIQVLHHRPVPSCSNTRWWMRFLLERENEGPKTP